MGVRVFTDSSVAKGIVSRRGIRKVRHIEIHQLWMQEQVQEGIIQVNMIQGIHSQVDILTKHVTGQTLRNHMAGLSHITGNGRHQLMPEVAGS